MFKAGDKVLFLSARDGSYRVTARTIGPDALYPLPGYVQTTAYDARTRQAQAVLDFGSKGMRYENTTHDPTTGADVTTVKVYRYLYFHWVAAAPAPPESTLIEAQSFPLWQVRAYLRTMLGTLASSSRPVASTVARSGCSRPASSAGVRTVRGRGARP